MDDERDDLPEEEPSDWLSAFAIWRLSWPELLVALLMLTVFGLPLWLWLLTYRRE